MDILDRLNLCYIWLKTYLSERRRWSAKRTPATESIRAFYGYESVPGADQQVFGGLVKLQDLQSEFPNQTDAPNVLYLVSSALPYFPVRMAEMAKKSGAKLVINQNGVAYPGWFGSGWKKFNKPMQQLHALADYVFYQSQFCKESADKFLGRRDSGYEILYNPVDTNYFCPADAKEPTQGPITLLLAGSHWSLYRPMVALDTLHRICMAGKLDVVLRIAGRFCWEKMPGDAEKQVMDYAAELGVGDRVELTGPYSQQQALRIFQSSSILLHTKYNDPCPRLVVEAMACGLPVVYSATGGVPELVGEEGGVGVAEPLDWEKDHPPDPQLLAEAVQQVAENLAEYCAAARQRAVKRFDTRAWLQRHRDVFKTMFVN